MKEEKKGWEEPVNLFLFIVTVLYVSVCSKHPIHFSKYHNKYSHFNTNILPIYTHIYTHTFGYLCIYETTKSTTFFCQQESFDLEEPC